ncbi:hypothetical protein FISHEDRAFT_34491, partial [Fistulina hepatica ATCC 64428]
LALLTAGETGNSLRLFDVARKVPEATHRLTLKPQPTGTHFEVSVASFSPDDHYLALACSDNTILVYDARFMDGLLAEYSHDGAPRVTDSDYGVVGAQWCLSPFDSSRMGLVTGGNDGCVRIWEPSKANGGNQGTVLVSMDSDIAAFSLGDRNRGEHDLVV